MAGDASETTTSGGGGALSEAARSLEFTPTWVLTTVTAVFVIISIAVQRFLHFLGNYFRETKRKPLLAALLKMKDELMLMGFISLTITIMQDPVSRVCVPVSAYNKWTPCDVSRRPVAATPTPTPAPTEHYIATPPATYRRRLLASESTTSCPAGYEPFISTNTIHQVHIFIVVLALVHVVYSCLTLVLAVTRVHRWRKWEKEAHDAAAQATMLDLIRNVTYTRQSTFVRYHTSKPFSRSRFVVWMVCFFQQFYIPRADYMALRHSFITTHNLRDSYDFHAYMVRTMEDEFETIVGISVWLWGAVLVFWVLNVDGAQLYFWTSLLPIIVVFVIGTKLQHVIATLALETERGMPRGRFAEAVAVLLQPRDQLFWFNTPKLLLHVIHLVLFETAFEFATFFWHVWQFGYHTCLLEQNKLYTWGRLICALAVLLFSSYSTLPLYALVTQMGSSYKKAVLTKNVERVLRQWHKDAKQRVKEKTLLKASSSVYTSDHPNTPSSHSMIVHFKSRITRNLGGSSSRNARSASFPAPTAALRDMEEGGAATLDNRSNTDSSSPSPAQAFYMRPLPPERRQPINNIPGSLMRALSPPAATTTKTTKSDAGTAMMSSTTIGEVQYLPPHPAFNHSRPAQLLRQSSTPNFEIHPTC